VFSEAREITHSLFTSFFPGLCGKTSFLDVSQHALQYFSFDFKTIIVIQSAKAGTWGECLRHNDYVIQWVNWNVGKAEELFLCSLPSPRWRQVTFSGTWLISSSQSCLYTVQAWKNLLVHYKLSGTLRFCVSLMSHQLNFLMCN